MAQMLSGGLKCSGTVIRLRQLDALHQSRPATERFSSFCGLTY
jgi:hypothetical protein